MIFDIEKLKCYVCNSNLKLYKDPLLEYNHHYGFTHLCNCGLSSGTEDEHFSIYDIFINIVINYNSNENSVSYYNTDNEDYYTFNALKFNYYEDYKKYIIRYINLL